MIMVVAVPAIPPALTILNVAFPSPQGANVVGEGRDPGECSCKEELCAWCEIVNDLEHRRALISRSALPGENSYRAEISQGLACGKTIDTI